MTELYSYPKELKKLRACLACHLLKTEEQVEFDYFILILIKLFSFYKRGVKIVMENGIKQMLFRI